MRELVFALGYTQHGGSGLGWNPAVVLDMDLKDIQWFAERLHQEREREAEALRAATRKGAR